MASLMEKLRVVVLGNAHDLLDRVIDTNSPTAIRQYVRDLEEALDKLKAEAAASGGRVRTSARRVADLTAKIETDKATTAKILASSAPNREDIARIKGASILQATQELAQLQKDLDCQKEATEKLDKSVTAIEGRHDLMVQQLRELESLDRDSKAKEAATHALTQAGKLVAGGADVSVDDVRERMRARNDGASEAFDRALGTTAVAEPPEQASEVDALLASLRPSVTG